MDSSVLDAKQQCNPAQAHSQLWPSQLAPPHCQIVQHFVKLVGTWDIVAQQVFHLSQCQRAQFGVVISRIHCRPISASLELLASTSRQEKQAAANAAASQQLLQQSGSGRVSGACFAMMRQGMYCKLKPKKGMLIMSWDRPIKGMYSLK